MSAKRLCWVCSAICCSRSGSIPRPQAPKPRVINTHAHFFPREYLDLIRAEGGPYKTEWHEEADGSFVVSGTAGRAGPLPPGVRDLEARIADMDRQGVDIQAMS